MAKIAAFAFIALYVAIGCTNSEPGRVVRLILVAMPLHAAHVVDMDRAMSIIDWSL